MTPIHLGNGDDTDFRSLPLDSDPACPFCREDFRAKAVEQNGTVFAVEDAFPSRGATCSSCRRGTRTTGLT